MSTPLDAAAIAKLLSEEAAQQSTRTRGPKVDPTLDRTYNGWFKLNTHICVPDCGYGHRSDPANPTAKVITDINGVITHIEPGAACWNPNCFDKTRIKDVNDDNFNRGIYVVALVKGQWICRYCYLANYLL